MAEFKVWTSISFFKPICSLQLYTYWCIVYVSNDELNTPIPGIITQLNEVTTALGFVSN